MNSFALASCVTTCIIIFTLFGIVLRYRRLRHLYKQVSKFPGPPTLPIIGNAYLFIGTTEDIFNKMIEIPKLYPTPFRVWVGSHLTFNVSTPEQLKVVLLSPKTIDKGELFDMGQPWLGTGLLTASAPKWQVHRKLIQPTFSSTILNSFVEIFAARSLAMAKEMERHLDGPEFDIDNYISQCTLYTVCDTTMGVRLDTQANGNECYADVVKKVIAGLCRRVTSPWLYPDFIFCRTQIGKNQQKHIKFLHTFTDNVIQAKHKELLEQNRQPELDDHQEDIGNSASRKKIFLDHLLDVSSRDNKILSDKAVREEVDTIMVAGSDTTAIMSSFVMLMLASHPEVQEKTYQELCEIYQDFDTEELRITPKDLTRMTYMERVIKETMRLFPITPILLRSVTDDLDIGERTFPAGSFVVISIIGLHRNGDIWPDPLKFDPDRFLPEEVKERHFYSYLPFSGGPRNCIGARIMPPLEKFTVEKKRDKILWGRQNQIHFVSVILLSAMIDIAFMDSSWTYSENLLIIGSKYAMMLMKTLLATILQRYVLKKDNIIPVKDIRLKWEFLLRPVEPIKLKIERRSREVASI